MIRVANKIRAEDLAREIKKTLHQYVEDVEANSKEAAEEVAKLTAEDLKENSPVGPGRKGVHYYKNWTYESYESGAIVFNKYPTSSLTHLLEKGHAKRNGGRVQGKPHIAPAEERAIEKYEQEIIRRV